MRTALADKGLEVNPGKCELIPPAGSTHAVPDGLMADIPRVIDGNFKLLGAPFGSRDFCEEVTSRRTLKTGTILEHAVKLHSGQASLLLIRNSGSFNKLTYSARTTPPAAITTSLGEFQATVLSALEEILRIKLDGRARRQASLSIRDGGLGLRDPILHAPAAYLSSLTACAPLCQSIDPAFTLEGPEDWSHLHSTLATLNADVLPDDKVAYEGAAFRQRDLSHLIDRCSLRELREAAARDPHMKAHLELVGVEGAGVWLTSLPGPGPKIRRRRGTQSYFASPSPAGSAFPSGPRTPLARCAALSWIASATTP